MPTIENFCSVLLKPDMELPDGTPIVKAPREDHKMEKALPVFRAGGAFLILSHAYIFPSVCRRLLLRQP